MLTCETIRPGNKCVFMTKGGCSFDGGSCQPAVEACNGCARTIVVNDVVYCNSCPDPAAKWKHGACNLATHVVQAMAEAAKINPLKASKRAAAAAAKSKKK